MKRALSAFSALLFSTIALADRVDDIGSDTLQWYQADLIVFLQPNAGQSPEQWPDIKSQPLPAQAVRLASPAPQEAASLPLDFARAASTLRAEKAPAFDIARAPFLLLPPSEYLLEQEAERLTQAPGYTLLMQSAWRFPVEKDDAGAAVVIRSALAPSSTYLVNGTIRISATKYLHAELDLWYNELKPEALSALLMGNPTDNTQNETPNWGISNLLGTRAPLKAARNFHQKERRRIQKSTELQYFDSPVIGVLLKLTPYKYPDSTLLPEVKTEE